MEGDQELKHVCKFCSKSFPCGRSLGGHMRSHVTATTTTVTPTTNSNSNLSIMDEKERKFASSSLNNTDSAAANSNAGYGLRENPKKTWRICDHSSEETLLFDKLCKECGKGFHSWKALFGHMKCHSERERVSYNNSLEDQDSWTNNNNSATNANSTHKRVMDSQSDNEATAPSRRRRSKRRTRYMLATTATVTTSFVANPSSSSLSEVEQEQEEVAMSLMMLSRDMSPWNGLHSVAESSDNNSACFQAPSSVRTNLVTKFESNNLFSTPSSNIAKLIKQSDGGNNKLVVGNSASQNPNSRGKKSSELLANEDPENEFRMNKGGVSDKGFIKNELEHVFALVDSEGELKRSRVNGTESVLSKYATNASKYSSIKTKFVGSESKSNLMDKAWETESSKNSNKRGKFECTTCNKIFHSYQALGGHRASHKKIKGCFASNNESSENSIETELSPDTATESKLMKNNNSEIEYHHTNEVDTVTESKKSKVHECPICLKVFPSGQALGGHKRSHMVNGGSESRNFQTVVPEIRNFLDLNLPANTEEESNSNGDSNRPWWILEDNHKQEALVGLIS